MFTKRLLLSALLVSLSLYIAGCGGGSKPVSVAVTASATTVDGASGNTVSLTATVLHDKGQGVSWAVTGGGSVAGTTTTATYTPPNASTSAVTATVTATSVTDSTKTASVQITVPAAPSISTSTMTAGTVGTTYSVTMAAAGGISPYTWSLTNGTLPAGLTMNSAGAITGTPMAAGVGPSNLTFKVTDSGKPNPLTATANLTLTVAAAPAITFGASTLTDGTMGTAYTGAVTASGGAGALTYTVSAGKLPDGLAMSTAGAITGTPTKVGTFTATVLAADAYGDSATWDCTIKVVYPALTVTALTPPVGYVGSAYTQTTLAATGGSATGYTWAVSSGSSLPAGLALSTAGVITGKPTTAGSVTTSVTVTDSAQNTATGSLSFTIKPAVSITSATTLPTGYVGSAYPSTTLAATGGSGSGYTWAVASGSTLPGGISLSAAGVLTGTPTTAATSTFTINVTDSASNTANATFSLTVSPGITIGALTLPKGYQRTAYPGATFTATGGSGSGYSWTWAAATGSSLPAGLALSTAGVVSGTPTAAGTFSIAVTVTDSASNTASQTFPLTIEATLAISSPATLKSGTVNVAYSTTLTATGGSGTYSSWTITAGAATLTPLSLSLSSGGVLSGTPTATGTATFTAQVTDSESHTATASLTVSVYSALTIITTSLPAGTVGVAYSQTLDAGGGSGTGYTWAASNSNLSTYGLTLSSAGVVSGSPTTAGTASFTPTVTDSSNNTATASAPLTITIYAALALPTTNPNTLPSTGTTGVAYTGSVSAAGGSGNYAWTITGMPIDGLSAATTGGTLNVTGTPTTAQTVTFTAKVTDTTTNLSVGPYTYTITISNPTPVTLPAPNPTSLPSATINQAYSGAINASGGVSPFTWSINGSAVPANGTPLALTNGLTATSSGGSTLFIGGTPTATGTVTLTNVKVVDSVNSSASNTYTIAVNSAGSQVGGQIMITNACAGNYTVPPITLTINTTPAQTTTTGNNGSYSFASIPNGTYTITPSINGPSSAFYPATMSVTVNNSDLLNQNFQVALGYTVSGTVAYTGSHTGTITIALNSTNCGSFGNPGTSISAPGAFTIHGVAPGSYTLQAWMDIIGQGHANSSDPQGTVSETVTAGNVANANITLADPSPSVPAAGPKIDLVMPTDKGVVISYKPTVDSTGYIETVTSYQVQWSTSSSFSSPSSISFMAEGDGSDVWILNSSTSGVSSGNFANGTVYYFRARGVLGSSQTPWTVYGGSTPTAITIGQPSGSGYNTVTGSVTIPSSVTIKGPLYTGFYSPTKGIFATRIAAPSNSSPNAYTVLVPSGDGYFQFAILDQNNDGLIEIGDISNTGSGNNGPGLTISGNLTGQNLTLSAANSVAAVYTQYYSQVNPSFTYNGYSLNIGLGAGTKLPVAATITSGPNIIKPVDMGFCPDCGTPQLQYGANLGNSDQGGGMPAVNDSYAITVIYSDNSTENLTAKVTGVLGPSQLATNLSPSTTASSLQPTFTWTYPANASNYSYSFDIYGNNGNGDIWYIPGGSSNAVGFTSSQIPGASITWGIDPTNSNNTPSVSSLTSGISYTWSITTNDNAQPKANGAQKQVTFVAP